MSVVLGVMVVAGVASMMAAAATVGLTVPPYDEPPDRARLATIPAVPVSALIPGETVKVVGRARMDEACLRSPETDRRCIGHLTQRRVDGQVARSGATVVDAFWLEDPTGRVRVRFQQGRLAVRPDHTTMLGARTDEAEGVLADGDLVAILGAVVAHAGGDTGYRAGARILELHLSEPDHVLCDLEDRA